MKDMVWIFIVFSTIYLVVGLTFMSVIDDFKERLCVFLLVFVALIFILSGQILYINGKIDRIEEFLYRNQGGLKE